MAKLMFLTILMVISSLSIAIYATKTGPLDTEESWFQIISTNGNEKTAMLHFYLQKIIGGENKTVYEGVFTSAGLKTTALAGNAYFYFTSGRINGSTISILGRDPIVMNRPLEMPIVGGTGMFRFARGYVIKNYTSIVENEYLLVQCTMYVTYMDN
ncbi:Dirigent protein 8 [Sesamum alatum]|uniref:Dirigent protein n=1 Tax=Sesamum alatum TaxID=300844 RepID=A0AAE1YVQ6_9LAMI|nr:Dirigent protein 8 [Sesamum alatum]